MALPQLFNGRHLQLPGTEANDYVFARGQHPEVKQKRLFFASAMAGAVISAAALVCLHAPIRVSNDVAID